MAATEQAAVVWSWTETYAALHTNAPQLTVIRDQALKHRNGPAQPENFLEHVASVIQLGVVRVTWYIGCHHSIHFLKQFLLNLIEGC